MLPDFVTIPVVATAHSRIATVELGQICILSHLDLQEESFLSTLLRLSNSYDSTYQKQKMCTSVKNNGLAKLLRGNLLSPKLKIIRLATALSS